MKPKTGEAGHKTPMKKLNLAAIGLTFAVASHGLLADEGGVSAWLPGENGSLVAVPEDAGWSLPIAYYHATADAAASESFSVGGELTAGIDSTADLLFMYPTYTFAKPVLSGQLAISLAWSYGEVPVSAEATLTGPNGNVLRADPSDSTTAGSDLYPQGTLRWNKGAHNYMAYTMAAVPVGAYDVGRLANMGINHWAIDGGAGYTYFNEEKGQEFSALAGLTYNWENPDTDYQNGVDAHLDWAVSQFLTEQVHVGLVGYWYQQLTGDSGEGATLGDFKSRVGGFGPQVGYSFEVARREWYVNLKGYWEFAAENRPEGWNLWLALDIPLETEKK